MRDRGLRARRLGKEVERFLVVIAHRRERLIHIPMPIGVALEQRNRRRLGVEEPHRGVDDGLQEPCLAVRVEPSISCMA